MKADPAVVDYVVAYAKDHFIRYGMRKTDRRWTERNVLKTRAETLRQLTAIADEASALGRLVSPMQVASILIERAVG